MNQLNCPHCGQSAISLLQKVLLPTRLSVTCRACGKGVVLSESAGLAYFPAVLLISISGLFNSYVIKISLWGLATIVVALLMKYWVPLKTQEHVIAQPLPHKGITIWIFAVLFASIASWSINFFPSYELNVLAVLLAAIATFPISRLLWLKDQKSEERMIWHGVCFFFVVATHYMAFAVVLPAYPVSALGKEQQFMAEVTSKSHSNKILSCSNSLDLREIGNVCVAARTWEGVRIGDSVNVVATQLWLGNYIKEVYLLPGQPSSH